MCREFLAVLPSVGIGALSARVAEGGSNTYVQKVTFSNIYDLVSNNIIFFGILKAMFFAPQN